MNVWRAEVVRDFCDNYCAIYHRGGVLFRSLVRHLVFHGHQGRTS